jgi:hypothetical protein
MSIPAERTSLEWLILADAAQIVGNKLYLIGGGWDVLTVNTAFPVDQIIGIAASFAVPWNETNQRHRAEITIIDEDGNTQMAGIANEFEVGRPPGIPAGSTQRTQVAGTLVLRITHAGNYSIRGTIDGEAQHQRAQFRVVAGPGVALRPEPPAPEAGR